ncbi:hypothetical protein [Desulforamulus profundi]|nr:hypothetical protein [Desulforamulus profundi]
MYSIKHENEEIKKVLAELDTLLAENNVSRFKERLSFLRRMWTSTIPKKKKFVPLPGATQYFRSPVGDVVGG